MPIIDFSKKKKPNKKKIESSSDESDYDDDDDDEYDSEDEYETITEDDDDDDEDEDDDEDSEESYEEQSSKPKSSKRYNLRKQKSSKKINIVLSVSKHKKDVSKPEDVFDLEDNISVSTVKTDDLPPVEEEEKDQRHQQENDTNPMDEVMKLYQEDGDDTILKDCIQSFRKKKRKAAQKLIKKNKKLSQRYTSAFRRSLHNSNKVTDVEEFKTLLPTEQVAMLKELQLINKEIFTDKPYRITLLQSNIPIVFKASALKKISMLKNIDPGSGEYYKCKLWVDSFMKIPFNKFKQLPVSFDQGLEICDQFITNAKRILDEAVFGLENAKMQILQWLGQLLTNPSAVGTSIAIHGPPGTGKTSLIKEGVSKILNRPFAFIALGGATDSSFLEGHGYTYEGSTYGKIVQILIESKCMNPIIYFDELDKISETPKGEEITGVLTHLTDTTQNSQFHDKFFSELEFDLSKSLFIFSYNDESKVNPILKDRMYRIVTKGFGMKQKVTICQRYLIPKIQQQVQMSSDQISFSDEVLQYIITTYASKEEGVRNLKRCIEIIFTKLNLMRLLKPDNENFTEILKLNITFPVIVRQDIVDALLTRDETSLNHLQMYI